MSAHDAVSFLRRLVDDDFFMMACASMSDQSAVEVAARAGYHFTPMELAEAHRTVAQFDRAIAAKEPVDASFITLRPALNMTAGAAE